MTQFNVKDIPEILPEIDKTSTYTVVTTYCTGRHQVERPVNRAVALRLYVRMITAAFRQDEAIVQTGAHVLRVDLVRRDDDGEIVFHTGTQYDIPVCDCSPAPSGDGGE